MPIFQIIRLLKAFQQTLPWKHWRVEQSHRCKEQIVSTSIDNVDIIGCEGGDYSPSEIFDIKKFQLGIDALKEAYDFILIETSALNDRTDTKELVQFVDAVIAVYSAESVIKEIDKESLKFLRQLNDKFLGVVLNKVKLEYISQ